ncbi:MAG TPA: pyridoxine 5'-phosphate oxidase C-terminal domain-containing protein [Acidimicrobiales bacterium]
MRVVPTAAGFWQGQPDRLHDRFRYVLEGTGWRIERLAP